MRNSIALLALACAPFVACKPPAAPANTADDPPRAPAAATPEAEAAQVFAGRCSPCHGATGAGDGAAAAALNPRPRNFREAAWQSGVTDAQIEQVIRQGGAAMGKSAAMPANPDLDGKPAVVAALRAMIRGMR
jgi:mono/diheme cytochrome c family protein